MKYTLLDLVQTILSSMESDEVNSINDSPEATAVATIVRSAYYDLVTRLKLPEHNDLFQLISSNDATKPTLMYLPSNVEKVHWIRYDKTASTDTTKTIKSIRYLELDDFMALTYNYAGTQNEVLEYVVPRGSININCYCRQDQAPLYYSTFDDTTVLFDSYDSSTDTMLVGYKTTCYGKMQQTFLMDDTFVPPLDEQQFALLLNEAKGAAWVDLKQMPNERAEKKVKQHLIASQYNKNTVGDTQTNFFARLPKYGRDRAYKPKVFRPID